MSQYSYPLRTVLSKKIFTVKTKKEPIFEEISERFDVYIQTLFRQQVGLYNWHAKSRINALEA